MRWQGYPVAGDVKRPPVEVLDHVPKAGWIVNLRESSVCRGYTLEIFNCNHLDVAQDSSGKLKVCFRVIPAQVLVAFQQK